MTKGLKILFVILVVLVGLLATTTGIFYAKVLSLQKENKTTTTDNKATTKNTDASASDTKATTTTGSDTSTVTTAAPAGNRPSSPADTVTVGAGETLFAIGQKVGVSWTILAEVNGIDANKIQAGETIIVPKNNQINYTVNNDKAASLQKEADSGKLAFRLSATDTAKSDAPPVYGLGTSDTYTQDKIDETAGTATVTATKADKKYTISLTQPVTKGAKGIWAIEVVKAQ